MDEYARRNALVSTDRVSQATRTIVASSGLLPPYHHVEQLRHDALTADPTWDRRTHETDVRLTAVGITIARFRRWLGQALIRTRREAADLLS